jgi:hypothetical protein
MTASVVWITAGIVLALLAIAAALVYRRLRALLRETEFKRARREFHQQRERLEAKFFELASNSGKPRHLRWTNCDFDNDVTYARHRRSGELCAFVSVTIAFEAVEGGMMEGVEAVGNLRAATSVFRYENSRWQTDGRAIFNLNPSEAVNYYHENLVLVGQEAASRS